MLCVSSSSSSLWIYTVIFMELLLINTGGILFVHCRTSNSDVQFIIYALCLMIIFVNLQLPLFVELLTQMYGTISESHHHHLCQFTGLSLWRNFICGTSKSDIRYIICTLCLIIIFVNLQSYLYGGILFVEFLTNSDVWNYFWVSSSSLWIYKGIVMEEFICALWNF